MPILNPPQDSPFSLGINYWPASSATYWWQDFDRFRLRDDMARIRETGFRIVRIFLLWEDFQPRIDKIATRCLDHLVEVAEQAASKGLGILPTFFTGHMFGVNWLPPWALWAREKELPYPSFSLGKPRQNLPRNLYEEPELIEAQILLLREVSLALKDHPAVWAWDLGNCPSRIVSPPDDRAAALWVRVMTEELRSRDEGIPITVGLSEEALWQNPAIRPQESGPYLDFLSIQAHPFDSALASDPVDPLLPPFLWSLTQWLSGKDVLLIGVGVPSGSHADSAMTDRSREDGSLVREEQALEFFRAVLDRLTRAGALGMFVSYFADFSPSLWRIPPLDSRVADRHLGVFRHDGSPKIHQPLFQSFSSLHRQPPRPQTRTWIDISREEYEKDSEEHLRRLYQRYQEHEG